MNKIFLFLFLFELLTTATTALAQVSVAPENLRSKEATLTSGEFLGRPSLLLKSGTALLNDAMFEDGVIEVDIAQQGELKGFAGVVFRARSEEDLEIVYLRLFKSGVSDAIQYTPRYQNIDCWQLYTTGYTGTAKFKESTWTHLKLEIENRSLRIFVNNAPEPNVVVDNLKRDEGRGMIGLWDGAGGTYFSNFTYVARNRRSGLTRPTNTPIPGAITAWEVSEGFPGAVIDPEKYPVDASTQSIKWERLDTEAAGLLNLSRYRRKERIDLVRFNNSIDAVYVRRRFKSATAQRVKLLFGYSDKTTVFLNGVPLFSGDSSFRSRDGGFLGAIALHDAVFLDLKAGDNELLFLVADKTGGWGIQARFAEARGVNLD